jgi:hypothetical protein
MCGTLRPIKDHMIDFKNLIVGRHESKVLFTWNLENGGAVLGAFLGIKDGIETILARDGVTPALRTVLEEFRAIAAENNWDFAALRAATGCPPQFILMARKSSSKLCWRQCSGDIGQGMASEMKTK